MVKTRGIARRLRDGSHVYRIPVVSVRVNKTLEGLPGEYRVCIHEELISYFMCKNEEIGGKRLGDL
jgi:hypothetical protein